MKNIKKKLFSIKQKAALMTIVLQNDKFSPLFLQTNTVNKK